MCVCAIAPSIDIKEKLPWMVLKNGIISQGFPFQGFYVNDIFKLMPKVLYF